jgi:polar amino acid transport system substrate-binding protein
MEKIISRTPLILISLLIASIAFMWITKKKPAQTYDPTKIIVGTNAEYPPFSFVKNDTIVGFDIDIAQEVCKRLNKKMVLIDMPFDALLPKIQLGTIQLVAAGMTITPERSKRVIFTRPYLTNDPLLIISLTNNPVASLADLQGKDVVVNDGYTADNFMSQQKGPILHRLSTPAEALLALRSGRAYAYVTARSTIKPFFDQYGEHEFQVTTIPDISDSYSLIISPQYPELLVPVQEALDAMEKDGTLALFKTKWDVQ